MRRIENVSFNLLVLISALSIMSCSKDEGSDSRVETPDGIRMIVANPEDCYSFYLNCINTSFLVGGFNYFDGKGSKVAFPMMEGYYRLAHDTSGNLYYVKPSEPNVIYKNKNKLFAIDKSIDIRCICIHNTDIVYCGIDTDGRVHVYKNGDKIYVIDCKTIIEDNKLLYRVLPLVMTCDDTDVYIGGSLIDNSREGRYGIVYKNDELLYELSKGGSWDWITAMVVKDDILYSAGRDGYTVKVWKNDKALYQLNDDDGGSGEIIGMSIVNDDLYCWGYSRDLYGEYNGETGYLWKNGKEFYHLKKMKHGSTSIVTSMCCKNQDIYIGGMELNGEWIPGNPDQSHGGWNYTTYPKLMKNGIEINDFPGNYENHVVFDMW